MGFFLSLFAIHEYTRNKNKRNAYMIVSDTFQVNTFMVEKRVTIKKTCKNKTNPQPIRMVHKIHNEKWGMVRGTSEPKIPSILKVKLK